MTSTLFNPDLRSRRTRGSVGARACLPTAAGCGPARARRRGGFSLLETTIAIGILGIGLIMVAAIFPVALWQHRDSVYQARATELVSKAETLLRSRLDPSQLWVSPLVQPGEDGPWQLLPTVNLALGGRRWDAMPAAAPPGYTPELATNYAYVINGATETDVASNWALRFDPPLPNADAFLNAFKLGYPHGLDILSDRIAPYGSGEAFSPLTDQELMDTANRLVWYGFYRRLANGTVHYAVAICRQQRQQRFAQQAVSFSGFQASPTALLPDISATRRLPVPWRVTVAYPGAGNRLYNMSGPEGLAELMPAGSKIMIHGATYRSGFPVSLPVPTGRILTVSDIFNLGVIEVREDVSDLLWDDVDGDGLNDISFDIWIFPPPVIGGNSGDARFDDESPLIDWKVLL